MDPDALAELAFEALTSTRTLRSAREHLHDLVEPKLAHNPGTAALWSGFIRDRRVPPELPAALAAELRHDERFANRIAELANRALWRRRLIPRRDLVLGIAVTLVGGAAAGGINWLLNPAIEPLAQDEVTKAEQAKAQSKGVLGVKAAYQIRGDAFGWAFAEPLSDTQVRDLLAVEGEPELGPLALAAQPVYIAYHYWGELHNFTRLRMTVVNHWPKPVLITDIKAKVKRTAPLSGALAWVGAQGSVEVIDIGFDLEEDDPRARVTNKDGTLGDPWTYGENVELEPGQTQPFNLIGRATKSYCEWHVEIHAEIEGQPQVFEVKDDQGKPFVTTAFADHYRQRFSYGPPNGLKWVERGEGGMFR
ncbi:hypothetical protein ACFXGA_00885 [Actinosynnema sp. NPDC059335]|uniref:hypothetical protein n=1 Tax=Actinosynnema sp. NPDC059335 TaxID=3346804 RepID=UPI00366F3408